MIKEKNDSDLAGIVSIDMPNLIYVGFKKEEPMNERYIVLKNCLTIPYSLVIGEMGSLNPGDRGYFSVVKSIYKTNYENKEKTRIEKEVRINNPGAIHYLE